MVKGIGSSCRHGGNPQKPQTEIGALRAQAKPYGGSAATKQTKEAADHLIEHCVTFLNAMHCYSSADCIVAMPPSDPSKAFNLPRYLAKRIAEKWDRQDLSKHVTGKPRNSIKEVPLAQKLDTLLGTIAVADGVFQDRKVLLLDDLYQSGVSMNYCGLLLLKAGAKKIFGLACEKTCRNDDNVGGKI
jgi:predicted amidophosphoribosyltransferase